MPSYPTAGVALNNQLKNANPERHYCQVSKGLVAEYEWMGYEVEKYSKEGVQTLHSRGLKPGQQIEFQDTVLMSCPVEMKKEREREGRSVVESRVSAWSSPQAIRGLPKSPGLRYFNDTTSEKVENI